MDLPKPVTEKYVQQNGKQETEIFINDENDISKRFAECKKNSGHEDFISLESFNINDLPENYRIEHLYEYIKALADLTVKIDVTKTGLDRPEFLVGTTESYPSFPIKTSGSGFVHDIRKTKNVISLNSSSWLLTCSCSKCKYSDEPKTEFWEIFVVTAPQVVNDASEALESSARLFYDQHESPSVLLIDCISFSNDSFHRSLLTFVTCDADICNKLERNIGKLRHSSSLLKDIEHRYNNRFIFIVSHPHGGPKKITIGKEHVKVFEPISVFANTCRFIYTVSTCPGSSGAPVYCLGFKNFENNSVLENYVIHCGVFKNHTFGYSGLIMTRSSTPSATWILKQYTQSWF